MRMRLGAPKLAALKEAKEEPFLVEMCVTDARGEERRSGRHNARNRTTAEQLAARAVDAVRD